MPTGVIFDMDGVLVMTETAHWRSWQAAGASRGVTIDHPTFLSCFGRVNPDCIRILFGPDVSPADSLQIADEKEAAFRDLIRADVPLAPGLLSLLDTLRAKFVRLGVGSSAPPANIDLVLDAGRIRHYFDAVADGSEVKRGKPAPDVFLLAASKMGVQPARCSVIEDAPAGIEAAVAAGMRAIGVATTHAAHQLRAAGAHEVFDDVRSIPPGTLHA
ncbi:MAG: HAD family phosphatase [Planctomycetota bacterium]